MGASNEYIASLLEQYADLLEVSGANAFRVRAYRGAARTISEHAAAVADLVARSEDLTALPGVGQDLAAKIKTVAETGSFPDLESIYDEVPREITELLSLPGLGPKRVGTLFRELGISSLAGLEQAASEGRIHPLPGMGKKTEQRILDAIKARSDVQRRFLRSEAQAEAEAMLARLGSADPQARLEVAGSLRRGKDTVGDLDILSAADRGEPLMEALTTYDRVGEVIARGVTKSSVRLTSGLQVDLRVVGEESFGAALHYFTGSQAHNMVIRREAQRRGLRVNEYGVFDGDRRVGGRSEDDVFEAVGLPWIAPELREDRGEVEAAARGALPVLVTRDLLRGDLHCHTTASDGRHSLPEMVAAARQAGLTYLAITDHSQSLTVANGLNEDRLLRQIEDIDRLNESLTDFTVLRGIEVDILKDGRLDLPDRVLARLDLVVASVHSHFELSREAQTERILRAMDNRFFSILAHPTGRRLPRRAPYPVDVERLIDQARRRGCFLECNANPKRLDLNDVFCRMAKEAGVAVSIASDSHRTSGFANLEYGVSQARRGWLTAADVLNARSLQELRPLLKRTMNH